MTHGQAPGDGRDAGGYATQPDDTPRPVPGHGHARHRKPSRRRGWLVAGAISTVAVVVVGVALTVAITAGKQDNSSTGASPAPPSGASMPAGGSPTSTAPGSGRGPGSRPSGQKVLKLADHPMLQDTNAGLQNLACELPVWRSDPAAAQAFFTAAADCLNKAWGPLLEHYDLPFVPPAVHFPTGSSFQTDCGTIQVGLATAAYYCENNLYVPFGGLQTTQYGNNPGVYLSLLAHEYGHHVQEVAGMMDAAWEQIYATGQNSAAGLEMARRKELQAQCFAGMFMGAHVDRGGSVTRDMYEKAWADQETRGDDTSGSNDHGTNAHYAQWWRTGAQDNRIAQCNTFAASSSEVR